MPAIGLNAICTGSTLFTLTNYWTKFIRIFGRFYFMPECVIIIG